MAAPQGGRRERLAAGVVSVLIPGIEDVFLLSFVGPSEEGLVFAVLAFLLLPGELLVLGEVFFEARVHRLSLGFQSLQLSDFCLHGFALEVSLVLAPAGVAGRNGAPFDGEGRSLVRS